jgi:asparagine synthase (glutamine-hydrolysing)
VTVALSGDGGDELFGGYRRYYWAERFWGAFGWIPAALRRAKGRLLLKMLPKTQRLNFARSGAEALMARSSDDLYLRLMTHWKEPEKAVIDGRERPTAFTDPSRMPRMENYADRMMYLDLAAYLPDDLLVKVDRASMAVSLEARVPLLDHRLIEFAWGLPLAMKMRGNEGKWLLRQVLSQYVPPSLVDRPKMGFGVPVGEWLRGPLREWAEELLSERRLKDEGFFDPAAVRAKWDEHLAGRHGWHYHLWDVLMFEAWKAENK